MKKKLKVTLAFIILAVTIVLFIRYARAHPAVIHEVKAMSLPLLLVLTGCYMLFFLALVWILRISMQMYGKTISRQENILLNAYSSLVNFFGPGQSGPAFRGLYLKKRHGLPIKNYLFASLLYYCFYAILSALLLFVGSRPWWQTTLLVLGVTLLSAGGLRWYTLRSKFNHSQGLQTATIGWLFAATALQVLMQTVIFYLELKEVHTAVSLSQAVTYTGAANFALFAALTPGAIGIREAFLVFTQELHHLNSTVIVAANVIDRAVYLVLLGLLAILALVLHAKDKLRIKQLTASDENSNPEK